MLKNICWQFRRVGKISWRMTNFRIKSHSLVLRGRKKMKCCAKMCSRCKGVEIVQTINYLSTCHLWDWQVRTDKLICLHMHACMCVCVYVRMYVCEGCKCVCMFACMYPRKNEEMYVCMYPRKNEEMYVCMYVCLYVCRYRFTYLNELVAWCEKHKFRRWLWQRYSEC